MTNTKGPQGPTDPHSYGPPWQKCSVCGLTDKTVVEGKHPDATVCMRVATRASFGGAPLVTLPLVRVTLSAEELDALDVIMLEIAERRDLEHEDEEWEAEELGADNNDFLNGSGPDGSATGDSHE